MTATSDRDGRDWGPLPGGVYPVEGCTLLAEHLNWMRRAGRSARTLRARRAAVVRLGEYLGADPADVTPEDLDGWQAQLPSLGRMRWATTVIRPYYNYLQARGHRRDNPAALLPLPAAPRRLPRPMPEDRVALAVAHAPQRLLPWLLLAGWCGLRAGEIAGLDVADFTRDAPGRMWVLIRGKGDHQRRVFVPQWLWQVLAPRLPDDGACFRRVNNPGAGIVRVKPRHVSQYCCRYLHGVGIPDTLHALRHRIATITLESSGGDLRLVQTLLGHLSIANTTLYTLVAPTRLADVLDQVPAPLGMTGPAAAPRSA